MNNVGSFKFPWFFLLGLLLGIGGAVGVLAFLYGGLPASGHESSRSRAGAAQGRPALPEAVATVELVEWFRLTDSAENSLREAARKARESASVLAQLDDALVRLAPLKNKTLERGPFLQELTDRLDKDQDQRFRDRLLKAAYVPSHTLIVPQTVRDALGIAGTFPVKVPDKSPPLLMPGSTALDPTRLARVRTRFSAEIREIGHVRAPGDLTDQSEERELRTGDRVEKGHVLAVVWSVDVGSKKSDLVDALVQLELDKKRLKARLELYRMGNLPEDTLNQTRRDVMSDQNAADRAERTLRTWNVPDAEIQAVCKEAEEIGKRGGQRDKEKELLWARSELIAPREGTIVERNVGVGEFVADNTTNLFTIADVDRMLVLAHPPEDQLPALLAQLKLSKSWTLRTVGFPPIPAKIDEVSYIIDANQHTAVVKGYIDTSRTKIRAGQFITASVDMPAPKNTVEVPLTALAEDGRQSFVFVQPDEQQPRYVIRRVLVTQRFESTAFVKSELTEDEQKLAPQEVAQGLLTPQPLQPGEQVITAGVLELRAALEDRESRAP